ncbi:MAG: TonB-dependent siderophore receptor [Sphingomonas sp.]|nr:TonB-dependent siderophore receptor [Sphingomonas sp.]
MKMTLLLSTAAGAALCAPAYAQDSASRADADIIVTGTVTKLDVPITKTPQSIAVIDSATVTRRQAQSVQEALRYEPAVQAEQSGRSGYEELQIRGFTQSQFQFRDGLSLDPGYLQQQEVFGLERIEILKGPASVLYGQIAPGGLVNSVSKVAAPEHVLSAEATGGSFGLGRIAVDLGGKLTNDGVLSGRVSALYATRDDSQAFAGEQRVFVQPSLSWRPDANTTLTLIGLYQDDRYRRTSEQPPLGTIVATPQGTVPLSRFFGEPGLGKLSSPQWQIGYLFEHRFSGVVRLRSKLRYLDYKVTGPITLTDFSAGDPNSAGRFGFFFRGRFNNLSLDNQVEIAGRTGIVQHLLLVGVDYSRYRSTSQGDGFDLPAIDTFAPVYGQAATPTGPLFGSQGQLDQLGVYGQYRATIADQFVLTGGLRWSSVKNVSTSLLGGGRSDQLDRKVTWNGAAMWLSPAGINPYVSYARSFQPQFGFDPLPGGATPPPALGEQVEVGVKLGRDGAPLHGTVAIYQLDQTNVVQSDPGNPGFSRVIGAQRNRGVEIEGSARLAPWVTLSAGYSYIDAKVRRSLNGDVGNRAYNVPEHVASGELLLDGAPLGLARWAGDIGVRYVGAKQDGSGPASPRLPDYALVDLGLRYRVGPATLGLSVKNLFDARYYTAFGFGGVVPGEARVAQGTVRVAL